MGQSNPRMTHLRLNILTFNMTLPFGRSDGIVNQASVIAYIVAFSAINPYIDYECEKT